MDVNNIRPKLCIENTGRGTQITIVGEAEHCMYAYALLGARLAEMSEVSIRDIALYLLVGADSFQAALKKTEMEGIDMSFIVPPDGKN